MLELNADALDATAEAEREHLFNHEGSMALVKAAGIDLFEVDCTVEVDPWFADEGFTYFLSGTPWHFQLGIAAIRGLYDRLYEVGGRNVCSQGKKQGPLISAIFRF